MRFTWRRWVGAILVAISGLALPAKVAEADQLPPDVVNFLTALHESTNPCPENLVHAKSAAFDEEQIKACIRWVWPDELEDRAIAVVFGHSGDVFARQLKRKGRTITCVESGGNPNAIGGAGEIGVFQLHPAHFGRRGFARKLGYSKTDARDPRINAELALWLYENSRSGWRNWTCSDRSWGRKG